MQSEISVSVLTAAQAEAVKEILKKRAGRLYVAYAAAVMDEGTIRAMGAELPVYLSGPVVLRQKELPRFQRVLADGGYAGILAKNLETLGVLAKEMDAPLLDVVTDCGLYVWNREVLSFYRNHLPIPVKELFLPLELNRGELTHLVRELLSNTPKLCLSSLVYGRQPMMISSSCTAKTTGRCTKQSGFIFLQDRLGKELPVFCDCVLCCNVIYNTLPLSLHHFVKELRTYGNLRLDFTAEAPADCAEITAYFCGLMDGTADMEAPPYKEYTTGHYKRGVQ